ncbi:ABC transporter permease [Micromonospora echinospora]|uniref:Carbohydrate ABC transporter membrane protein 2, CUT1 family (TC 3.A.1.1.-) n=1 Tax=Micromonospora echinospora TaxID=1877 RepID=A0A1C4UBU6_MICEC|nr:carbohydrate ABC transporter permease [Micromonospora echinospora]OZV80912.1 ABC transporter permease [Micromonospora echinospora]SCE69099.1 carbohydrate ABC transporter membrane protein 2, CUT1 family (TC 3.A.1.1.-) [Micromonospora echinospora]
MNTHAARIGRYLLTFALVVVAVAAIYPLLFTVVSSLKTQTGFARDPLGLPTSGITLENYVEAFRRMDMPRLLFNSLVTTVGGLVLSVLAALLVAYVVTKLRFRGKKLVFLLIIVSLTIPSQAIIYPLYQTVLDLGMSGEYQGLILAYAAFGLPLGTYQLAGYFQQIPDELIEAARVDGAGHFTVLFRLLTPIATPALAALAIFNFVWMWNDLLLPLVIMGGSDSKTLMVGVSLLSGQYDVSVPLVSAGLIVALLPVLIIYLVFQRQLVSGALAGSGK